MAQRHRPQLRPQSHQEAALPAKSMHTYTHAAPGPRDKKQMCCSHQAHNLALLARISLFHSLGCPILLGASRKAFIKTIGKAEDPLRRVGGSVAVALEGVAQGVQIVRVHDVQETRQALRLWQAVTTGEYCDS